MCRQSCRIRPPAPDPDCRFSRAAGAPSPSGRRWIYDAAHPAAVQSEDALPAGREQPGFDQQVRDCSVRMGQHSMKHNQPDRMAVARVPDYSRRVAPESQHTGGVSMAAPAGTDDGCGNSPSEHRRCARRRLRFCRRNSSTGISLRWVGRRNLLG
jgi:hypothetical protein